MLQSATKDVWAQRLQSRALGLWCGDGLSNQGFFKVSTAYAELQKNTGEGSGFVISRGKARLAKFVSSEE